MRYVRYFLMVPHRFATLHLVPQFTTHPHPHYLHCTVVLRFILTTDLFYSPVIALRHAFWLQVGSRFPRIYYRCPVYYLHMRYHIVWFGSRGSTHRSLPFSALQFVYALFACTFAMDPTTTVPLGLFWLPSHVLFTTPFTPHTTLRSLHRRRFTLVHHIHFIHRWFTG